MAVRREYVLGVTLKLGEPMTSAWVVLDVPAVKDAARSLSATEALALADLALDQHSAAGVRALLDPRAPT
jgi:hypothetical protein